MAFSLQGAGTGSEIDERVHWTGTSPRYKSPGTAAGPSPDPATRQSSAVAHEDGLMVVEGKSSTFVDVHIVSVDIPNHENSTMAMEM